MEIRLKGGIDIGLRERKKRSKEKKKSNIKEKKEKKEIKRERTRAHAPPCEFTYIIYLVWC